MDVDPPEVQQVVPIPQNNEGMLPSSPSSIIGTKVFREIWTTQKSLGSSSISSKG
jgi:hypothetical protein